MRSSVDLPQPDGPDQHEELAVGDLERDVVDGDDAANDLRTCSRWMRGHRRCPRWYRPGAADDKNCSKWY